jgi:hypothetical protein
MIFEEGETVAEKYYANFSVNKKQHILVVDQIPYIRCQNCSILPWHGSRIKSYLSQK